MAVHLTLCCQSGPQWLDAPGIPHRWYHLDTVMVMMIKDASLERTADGVAKLYASTLSRWLNMRSVCTVCQEMSKCQNLKSESDNHSDVPLPSYRRISPMKVRGTGVGSPRLMTSLEVVKQSILMFMGLR
jgi:hypothetical protein